MAAGGNLPEAGRTTPAEAASPPPPGSESAIPGTACGPAPAMVARWPGSTGQIRPPGAPRRGVLRVLSALRIPGRCPFSSHALMSLGCTAAAMTGITSAPLCHLAIVGPFAFLRPLIPQPEQHRLMVRCVGRAVHDHRLHPRREILGHEDEVAAEGIARP